MMFRRHARGADPRWEVAASTQVFSAPRHTVVQLVRDVDPNASECGLDGVLIARSHPTGWFLCAVRRDDLPPDDVDHFSELVTVRSYVLLRHGPQPLVWRPTPRPHEWRSAAASVADDLADVARDLGH